MTNKDSRELADALRDRDIFSFAERMCKKAEVDPADDYPQKVDSPVMHSAARRQLYMARTLWLLRRMIFMSATSLEVLRASEYLMVINQSIDRKLDWRECEKVLKIGELQRKYDMAAFLTMETTAEELKSVLQRDDGYYPVPIKEATPE